MFTSVHQQNDPGVSSHELYSCCSVTHLPQGRGIHSNDRVIEIVEWPSDILLLKFALPFYIFNCFYLDLFYASNFSGRNMENKMHIERTLESLVTTGLFTGRRDEIL